MEVVYAFPRESWERGKIDVSVAYAVWSGVGTTFIAFVGVWVFAEEMSWFKAVSIGLIILGVVGLQMCMEHR